MSNAILVVGGGFAGLTAAIEAAELGHDVFIVEKSPWLGGRVAQLNKYFPKLCPPSCGLEIQFQRIRNNPRIKFFTQAQVVGFVGVKGDYKVQVRIEPRHTAPHNVDFSLLASSLEGTTPSEFDLGLGQAQGPLQGHALCLSRTLHPGHAHPFQGRYGPGGGGPSSWTWPKSPTRWSSAWALWWWPRAGSPMT